MSTKKIDVGKDKGVPEEQVIPLLQLRTGIINPETGLANDSALECPRCGYKIRESTDPENFKNLKDKECPACFAEQKLEEPKFEVYAVTGLISDPCAVCGKSPSVGTVSFFTIWGSAEHIVIPLCLKHFNKKGFIEGLYRSENTKED